MKRNLKTIGVGALVLAPLLAVVVACTVNPATGKRQLNIFSEAQEIEIGKNADPQIVAQFGLYPDEDLQRYVDDLGQSLAAQSERPDLPWTFRVVDDPLVNAFALPGGYIYITRGILAHMGSEAELAGVLGHEIGHITARHGVNQMTKQQFAQIGLVAGVIAAPDLARQFGGLAQNVAGLMFLKFGRDDERQADALGFRYMSRVDEPPGALADVFRTLGRVSRARGGGDLPDWMSTHPAPEDREERIRAMLETVPPRLANASPHRERYLDLLDDVVYGDNPRQGFFRGSTFYHPELAFELTFPDGWQTQNQRQAVVAVHPDKKAILVLTLTGETDARTASRKFFEQSGVESYGRWSPGRGFAAEQFRYIQQEQERLRGGVAFKEYGGRVYRMLAYAGPDDWSRHDRSAEQAVASFRELRDRRLLDVQPRRLEIIELDRAMTIEDVKRRHRTSASVEDLALLNQVDDLSQRIAAGTRLKLVRGEDPSAP